MLPIPLPSPPPLIIDALCRGIALTAVFSVTRDAAPTIEVNLDIDAYQPGAHIGLLFSKPVQLIRITGPSRAEPAQWRPAATTWADSPTRPIDSPTRPPPVSSARPAVAALSAVDLFAEIDSDQSGYLSGSELAVYIRRVVGKSLDLEELAHMVGEVDKDGDGKLSPSEMNIILAASPFRPLALALAHVLALLLPPYLPLRLSHTLGSQLHCLTAPKPNASSCPNPPCHGPHPRGPLPLPSLIPTCSLGTRAQSK